MKLKYPVRYRNVREQFHDKENGRMVKTTKVVPVDEPPSHISVGGEQFACSGGVVDVSPKHAQTLLSQGWTPAEEPVKKETESLKKEPETEKKGEKPK